MSDRKQKKKPVKKTGKKPVRTKKAPPAKNQGAGAKPLKKQPSGVNTPRSPGGKPSGKTIKKSGGTEKKISPKTAGKTVRSLSGALLGKVQKGMERIKKKASVTPLMKKKAPVKKSSPALKKGKTSPKSAGKTIPKPSGDRPPSQKKAASPPRAKITKPKPAKGRAPQPKTASKPVKQALKLKKTTPKPLPSPAKKALTGKTAAPKKSPNIKDLNTARKELENVLKREKEEKFILRNMEGRNYCLVEDCGFSAVVEGYCRLHYMGRWEHIIKRKKILETGILEKRIEPLVSNYPTGVLNFLLQDLKEDKVFDQAVKTVAEDAEDTEFEDVSLD